MGPLLAPGEWAWATPRTFPLPRHSLVIVSSPRDPAQLLIKRIVGLPMETVALIGRQVEIGGRLLSEPYVDSRSALQPLQDICYQLRAREYVILGDARDDSLDSRRLGPIPFESILARVTFRWWPLSKIGPLAVFFLSLWIAGSVNAAPTRLFAFANKQDLLLSVGKFDSARGWVEPDDFYAPPQPADPVTLIGLQGRLGVARITSPWRASPTETPADWTAKVSRWNWDSQAQALAIFGNFPDPIEPVTPLAVDGEKAQAIVKTYLTTKGLRVDHPHLTQAFEIDVDGDRIPEQFYAAHSDDDALKDDQAGATYAVALMVWKGKTLALASQTWFKPAFRTKAEEATLEGTRDYLRFLAVIDLNGDGLKEIVLYKAKTDATQVDVFTLEGARLREVLTAFRMLLY